MWLLVSPIIQTPLAIKDLLARAVSHEKRCQLIFTYAIDFCEVKPSWIHCQAEDFRVRICNFCDGPPYAFPRLFALDMPSALDPYNLLIWNPHSDSEYQYLQVPFFCFIVGNINVWYFLQAHFITEVGVVSCSFFAWYKRPPGKAVECLLPWDPRLWSFSCKE